MWKKVSSPIDKLTHIAPTRVHYVAWGLVNLSALVLSFVPLFNLVGYESAAFFGVVLGLFSLLLTVYSIESGVMQAPLSSNRKTRPAFDFGRLTLMHLALGLGPLLMLTLNGLRVTNCDWGSGFLLWGLIVVPSILLGQGAAWVATSVVPGRKVAPWIVALSFPIADGLALLYHLATEPPIVGHQWFLGYFGGSIYDEALAVPPSLIAYRLMHIAAIVAVVAAIDAAFSLRRRRWPAWTLILAVGAALVFVVGFSQRADFGISIDADYVVDELGGTVESEHFVIHYPKKARHIERLDEMVDDHEFRYHQLRQFFGTDPVADSGRKVRSFVYDNRRSKGRLMGGHDTMVAKLWLHEMHILWRGTGDAMLAHELAHIFTEPFGAGPLRLSMQRGIGVNMGLVEGIAVAAEWRARHLTPHEASAAMRQLEIAPDLRQILGAGGFWTEASGRAYTAMGSFVRFLVDEHGIEPFKEAYGGGNFRAAYGVDVHELIDQWEDYVDQLELTPRQLSVASDRYDRPSIFGKVCARALGEKRRQARYAASRGDLGRACDHYEALLDQTPENPSALLAYGRVLSRMDSYEEALTVINRRSRSSITDIEEARFLEFEGDLLWSMGDEIGALRAFEQALAMEVGIDQERSLVLKHRLVGQGEKRGRQYLVGRPGDVEAMYIMMNWRFAEPDDRVVAYLLGRRLWQQRKYGAAIEPLEQAAAGLDSEVLDAEASLMLGESYYFQGRYQASNRIWSDLENSQLTRYREAAHQWLARLQWAQRNRE